MISKFSITLKQQILMLLQPICAYIFILGGTYFYINESSIGVTVYLVAITFIFFTDTLPAIIIHIQYFMKNHTALLLIDDVNRTFCYKDLNNQGQNTPFDDINSIQFVVSNVRNTGIYSFARYRYCRIVVKGGKEFTITCLMINDVENTLELLLHIKPIKELKTICFL